MNELNCLPYKERERESLYTSSMPGRCHTRGPPGIIIPGAEHPEPDVVLRYGWMAGASRLDAREGFGHAPE
ncbi:hypothetical protein K440DRAFT_376735 [Wilcoxina mikolae CBS 423.85]|nr:hypothetical protein K440DRAFT_376735 [Wilcoxina mikolae CBS 423.85]